MFVIHYTAAIIAMRYESGSGVGKGLHSLMGFICIVCG